MKVKNYCIYICEPDNNIFAGRLLPKQEDEVEVEDDDEESPKRASMLLIL
jgi:hypothetical protein